MKSEKVTQELEKLLELSKSENDIDAQVIILALLGARAINDEQFITLAVQDCVKNILLPRLEIRNKMSKN